MHDASQDHLPQFLNSAAPDVAAQALTKRMTTLENQPYRPTDNLPFDGYGFNNKHRRADHEKEGDVFRISKCYCIDTPSRDLPPVYGQFYGSHYGFDYYNYHLNRSYSFAFGCANGELETLNSKFNDAEAYYLAPSCLAWMEEEKRVCWHTPDGNDFCAEVRKGYDYYYWNGQKRKVLNRPPREYTLNVTQPVLSDQCQRMCQKIPARTPGYMLDAIPYDHENKLILETATVCAGEISMPGASMHVGCDYSWEKPKKVIPRTWEVWNWIETYSDQADMCKGCK